MLRGPYVRLPGAVESCIPPKAVPDTIPASSNQLFTFFQPLSKAHPVFFAAVSNA